MSSQNLKLILSIFLIAFTLSGCSLPEPTAEIPSEDPAPTSELPPTPDPKVALCEGLSMAFSGAFQTEMSTANTPFQDIVSGQTIDGCLSTLRVPGENIPSLGEAISLSDALIKSNGWEEDIRYGAGGAFGIMNGYRKNDSVCTVTTEFGPLDDNLCSSVEPFTVCIDRMSADQKIYKVALNCAVVPGSSTSSGNLPQADFSGVLPPAFNDELVQSMELTKIPPMIPTSFLIGDEMALYADVLSMEEGIYEIRLDFGEECHGADACHFGVLAGSLTSGNELYSTPNIFVDVERAVPVTLANGITGYYIEGLCGASCDNSLIVWVQDFYQYIIGSKAASQAFLLDMVNSAVANKTP